MYRSLKIGTALSLLLLLAGCGATGTKNAQSSSSHRTSQTAQSSHSQHTHSSSSTSQSSQAKTATFANSQFTIDHVTYNLTGTDVTASATANRNLFVIYYTVTNQQSKAIVPSDLWESSVTAKQDGKKLGTGNLAFTTSQTKDNDLLNNTVMPVKPGKTAKGLAMFEPKNTDPVSVTFSDTHGQVVHTSQYNLN
ncbi:DUF5067 domain-containing protein [Levilactobacillus parabrevis]|uniref:DUF5067 domain-containing protein n=1 Tax=Levilactobacillus parabrevis ATCC 53295 TaxID=1267003 RepID=A0A0R1GU76_9LACO|nr:DUF5067 domain-containing protein [Levilactobacillus parabrevis]KRK37534.1 hypothetical protein FD07_GL000172 [Levilactobacillus parabrevis ATCC 53295]KRO05307.1 hypothetical protein IV61_GL001433 [Levilactobacillus parabrevis]